MLAEKATRSSTAAYEMTVRARARARARDLTGGVPFARPPRRAWRARATACVRLRSPSPARTARPRATDARARIAGARRVLAAARDATTLAGRALTLVQVRVGPSRAQGGGAVAARTRGSGMRRRPPPPPPAAPSAFSLSPSPALAAGPQAVGRRPRVVGRVVGTATRRAGGGSGRRSSRGALGARATARTTAPWFMELDASSRRSTTSRSAASSTRPRGGATACSASGAGRRPRAARARRTAGGLVGVRAEDARVVELQVPSRRPRGEKAYEAAIAPMVFAGGGGGAERPQARVGGARARARASRPRAAAAAWPQASRRDALFWMSERSGACSLEVELKAADGPFDRRRELRSAGRVARVPRGAWRGRAALDSLSLSRG